MFPVAGSFSKTIEAIESAKHFNLAPEIHFVPFAENFKYIRKIVKFAADIGVTKVSILRFVPQGRGVLYKGHALNRLQDRELRKTILDLQILISAAHF